MTSTGPHGKYHRLRSGRPFSERRSTAFTSGDEIRSLLRRSLQDLLGSVADEDVGLKLHIPLLCLTLHVCEQLFVATPFLR
jgi:hypothetical protein